MTHVFPVMNGLQQGDDLSPLLPTLLEQMP
jgi:hypothetical protein